jgi:hypothetical protein
MTTSVVIGRILFPTDEQFRMEELTVGASANFVNWGRVKVDEDGSRNVFAASRLCEEGVVGASSVLNLGIGV